MLEYIPPNLLPLSKILKDSLTRCDPWSQQAEDNLGWKSHVYTVKESYEDIFFLYVGSPLNPIFDNKKIS